MTQRWLRAIVVTRQHQVEITIPIYILRLHPIQRRQLCLPWQRMQGESALAQVLDIIAIKIRNRSFIRMPEILRRQRCPLREREARSLAAGKPLSVSASGAGWT